ncbi:MAG: acyl carrier protein [Acidipropionibacterium sp.]|jgi:acyl carrier protein|nr:acyl carrier protein [Acidipropionibacterium sp.]
MHNDDITPRERVRGFVLDNLLLGDTERMPTDDASLLDSGVIDSTGILELIEFLEETFGISVADNETVPENLDGVDRVVAYLSRKQT